MPLTRWCWRCRREVLMLEPAEWALLQEARGARGDYLAVLERARERMPGATFTPLPATASPEDRRLAILTQSYELLTGVRELAGRITAHHQTALFGPDCASCGKPFRTPSARRCAACGTVRPEAAEVSYVDCAGTRVRLHAWPPQSLEEVLVQPLPRSHRHGEVIGDEGERFLQTLAEVMLAGQRGLDDASLPDRAAMASVLQNFHLMVLAEKTQEWVESDAGNELPRIARWSEEIGATRWLAFVQALLALVPAELWVDPDERGDYLAGMREGPSLVSKLEQTYWDAPLELSDRMRDFVLTHRAEFEQARGEGGSRSG